MNMKKFMAVGLISLIVLVGCNTTEQTISNGVEKASTKMIEASEEVETDQVEEKTTETEESSVVDQSVEEQKVAAQKITTLASLIGKSSSEVRSILGDPSTSKNLENTDTLLVDYYKLEYLDETAKIEVIYNDDKQQVNFVSFVILSSENIEGTKENLMTMLTNSYGEGSIERIVDKSGRKNKNWTDGTLIYDLTYFENNISLDIYEADK